MQNLKRFAGPVLAICMLMPGTSLAEATDWHVQAAASEILFEYSSDGTPKTGVFGSFNGNGRFDADDPTNAKLELKIETASIDLYDVLASGFAQSAEWFDSKNHPNVIYRLNSLKLLEGNRYEAKGLLTIRGEERPITSEIELEIGEATANAKGSLVIVRGDYLLGVGPSAAFVDVSPEVTVRFDLQAARSE